MKIGSIGIFAQVYLQLNKKLDILSKVLLEHRVLEITYLIKYSPSVKICTRVWNMSAVGITLHI